MNIVMNPHLFIWNFNIALSKQLEIEIHCSVELSQGEPQALEYQSHKFHALLHEYPGSS